MADKLALDVWAHEQSNSRAHRELKTSLIVESRIDEKEQEEKQREEEHQRHEVDSFVKRKAEETKEWEARAREAQEWQESQRQMKRRALAIHPADSTRRGKNEEGDVDMAEFQVETEAPSTFRMVESVGELALVLG